MARKPRINFPGAFYHCINRGNQRKSIFLSDDDFLFMLDTLARATAKYEALIHAFCLMPNHFHVLIQVQKVPLSTIMRSSLTAYARYFNRAHHKTGHVFQGRYRAILCQKDSYLLELTRYIHLNPLRSHLTATPQQWRWSSLNAYLHPAEHQWLYTKDILGLFGKKTRTRLAEFLCQDSQLDPADIYPSESFPILGDDTFTKTAADPVALRRQIPRTWPGPRFSLQELSAALAEENHLPLHLLGMRHKGPHTLSDLRACIVYSAIQYGSYKNAQLASFLHISSSAVSNHYRKFLQRINSDPSLEVNLFQSLKSKLLNN